MNALAPALAKLQEFDHARTKVHTCSGFFRAAPIFFKPWPIVSRRCAHDHPSEGVLARTKVIVELRNQRVISVTIVRLTVTMQSETLERL